MSNRNPRLNVVDAVKMAEKVGMRVKQKWDGHYLFYADGGIVSVHGGRGDDPVPPRLAITLRRAWDAKHSLGKHKIEGDTQMPPDHAPRPGATVLNGSNGKAENLIGQAGATPTETPPSDFTAVMSFFGKIQEAKRELAILIPKLEEQERFMYEAEEMYKAAKDSLTEARAKKAKYEGILKGVPQNMLDLMG